MGLFNPNLGGLIDNLVDFFEDLNLDRLDVLDLGGLFKDLGNLSFISDLNLNDLFKVVSNVDVVKLVDLFDSLKKLGVLDTADLKDLKTLITDLGNLDLFGSIELSDLFKGLSLDNLSGLFGSLAVGKVFDQLGKTLEDLKGLELTDALKQVDLLGGLGEILDALGNAGFLEDWVILDMNRGSNRRDTLTGSDVGEFLLGLSGADKILGGRANDIINGGRGNDRLFGLNGNDILAGVNGRNVLNGGRGNDILIANGKGDRLIGGKGRNAFVFDGSGKDHVVVDFKVGKDQLVVTGSVDLNDLGITQQGRHALLTVGRTTLALVKNIEANGLNVDDVVQIANDML
jgi:hypothetical protein